MREKAGSMYEVNINANAEDFLDWDKPLTGDARLKFEGWAKSEIARLQQEGGTKARRRIEDIEDMLRIKDVPFGVLARQLDLPREEVTQSMGQSGIPGIKYLDQGSRGAGEGSRNYVVFDDSLIEIVAKNGEPVGRPEWVRQVGDALQAAEAEAGEAALVSACKIG